MNRKYEAAQYRRIVGEIVAAAPGVAVGADVIVGFPGETEEEFRNTGEFIESLPLAYLHVFSYSRRPGTPAACMPDQVPDGVKRQRCRALRALSERKALAFRRQLLGTRQTVVIEKDGGGEASGLTGNYVRVRLPNAPPVGSLVEVEITGVNGMEVLAHPLCSAGL
jgi:threonylcarbamoyladenosine tRNA methylthiotransferase MtaB